MFRNRPWLVKDRERFIEILTATGNPALAAAAIGQKLAAVYAMRDRSPELAQDWARALGIAWEQVEMRMLSSLLEGAASDVDPRVALAVLKRQPPVAARAMRTIDAVKIAAVRSDIKALAAPND